jgi:hypothetical protein
MCAERVAPTQSATPTQEPGATEQLAPCCNCNMTRQKNHTKGPKLTYLVRGRILPSSRAAKASDQTFTSTLVFLLDATYTFPLRTYSYSAHRLLVKITFPN